MSNEILTTQLVELNSRSRWYSSQNWQVPFAYVGIISIFIPTILEKKPEWFGWATFFAGILGVLVQIHMFVVLQSIKRVVLNIQAIERTLGLEVTAKYNPFPHYFPIFSKEGK